MRKQVSSLQERLAALVQDSQAPRAHDAYDVASDNGQPDQAGLQEALDSKEATDSGQEAATSILPGMPSNVALLPQHSWNEDCASAVRLSPLGPSCILYAAHFNVARMQPRLD